MLCAVCGVFVNEAISRLEIRVFKYIKSYLNDAFSVLSLLRSKPANTKILSRITNCLSLLVEMFRFVFVYVFSMKDNSVA